MNQSIDAALVDWAAARSKRQQDSKIIQYMLLTLLDKKDPNILCMPAGGWMFERALIEAFPSHEFSFQGVERDKGVYTASARTLKSLGSEHSQCEFRLHYGCVGTKLEHAVAEEQAYDVIYLDYMGTWSCEKQGHIRDIIKSRLLKTGGTLILTLALNRGQPETNNRLSQAAMIADIMETDYWGVIVNEAERCTLKPGTVSNMKVSGIPAIIQQMAAQDGILFNFVGGAVYDSFSKVGANSCAPEMSMALHYPAPKESYV